MEHIAITLQMIYKYANIMQDDILYAQCLLQYIVNSNIHFELLRNIPRCCEQRYIVVIGLFHGHTQMAKGCPTTIVLFRYDNNACMYVCMYVRACVRACARARVCVGVRVCGCVCVFAHTYINTLANQPDGRRSSYRREL